MRMSSSTLVGWGKRLQVDDRPIGSLARVARAASTTTELARLCQFAILARRGAVVLCGERLGGGCVRSGGREGEGAPNDRRRLPAVYRPQAIARDVALSGNAVAGTSRGRAPGGSPGGSTWEDIRSDP